MPKEMKGTSKTTVTIIAIAILAALGIGIYLWNKKKKAAAAPTDTAVVVAAPGGTLPDIKNAAAQAAVQNVQPISNPATTTVPDTSGSIATVGTASSSVITTTPAPVIVAPPTAPAPAPAPVIVPPPAAPAYSGTVIYAGAGGRTIVQRADGRYYIDGLPSPYVDYPIFDLTSGSETPSSVGTMANLNAADKYYYFVAPNWPGKIQAHRINPTSPSLAIYGGADAYELLARGLNPSAPAIPLNTAVFLLDPSLNLLGGTL